MRLIYRNGSHYVCTLEVKLSIYTFERVLSLICINPSLPRLKCTILVAIKFSLIALFTHPKSKVTLQSVGYSFRSFSMVQVWS